jgi:hypothetical protein
MLRIIFALSLAAVTSVSAQTGGTALSGHLEGNTYVSPTGAVRYEIPVMPELGGTIVDTDNVVTFQDDFTTLVTIGAFRQDATQRWQLATLGLKDYLKYFFTNFVAPDFGRAFPGSKVETNARFAPSIADGALITFMLMPGGSMFASKIPSFLGDPQSLVAKRANMIFVKNGFTFVVSTELAERITERTKYKLTTDEEDNLLRTRLSGIFAKIQFTKPAPTTP